MKARNWFKGFGRNASHSEQMAAVKAQHGKGAAGWLAKVTGLKERQAREHISGRAKGFSKKTAEKVGRKLQQATSRNVAAQKLRNVDKVQPGTVAVDDDSPKEPQPGGTRKIPEVDVSSVMDQVADLVGQGKDEEAEELFNNHVLDQYGSDLRGHAPDDRLSDLLSIRDYKDGIKHTERPSFNRPQNQ